MLREGFREKAKKGWNIRTINSHMVGQAGKGRVFRQILLYIRRSAVTVGPVHFTTSLRHKNGAVVAATGDTSAVSERREGLDREGRGIIRQEANDRALEHGPK